MSKKGREFDHSHYQTWVDPNELIPYPKNAKQHDKAQVKNIANSIRRFGWQQEAVVTQDNVLVIGHGRRLAALMLKCEMPVKVIDQKAEELTDEDIRELRIADNKTNESPWDFELLTDDLDGLEFEGFDFEFDLPEEEEPVEITEDDYDKPLPEEPKSKLGDIYQLGRHRLMCGDSTNENDIDALMNGDVADIVITSPPYGAGKSAAIRDPYVPGKERRKSFYNEHEDDPLEWGGLISAAMGQMMRVSKAQFVNIQMLAGNKVELIDIVHHYKDRLVDIIVWDKCKAAPQMEENVLNNQFEFVFVFGDDNATRAILFSQFHGNKNNLISFTPGNNEYADIHRAVFPIRFPAEILGIANKAETVLDVFGGTGTTLIACEQSGKTCFMMELDPAYVDVIIDRWETFTGEKAVLING